MENHHALQHLGDPTWRDRYDELTGAPIGSGLASCDDAALAALRGFFRPFNAALWRRLGAHYAPQRALVEEVATADAGVRAHLAWLIDAEGEVEEEENRGPDSPREEHVHVGAGDDAPVADEATDARAERSVEDEAAGAASWRSSNRGTLHSRERATSFLGATLAALAVFARFRAYWLAL